MQLIVKFSPFLMAMLLLLASYEVVAQRKVSLNECLEMGLKNSEDALQQHVNIEIARNNVDRAKAPLLPQVNATVDFRDNTKLQTNIIPAGVFGSEARAVQFGTTYNFIAGFGLTQNVYDHNVNSDRDIAGARVKTREEELKLLETNVKLNIAKAYYDVVLKKQVLLQTQAAQVRAREFFSEAEAKHKQGTMLDAEYSRAMLESSNAQAAVSLSDDAYALSLLALKRSMGMPMQEQVEVADDMQSLLASSSGLAPVQGSANARPEFKLEQAQQQVNELYVNKYEKAWIPSVQLYANLSANYLSNDLTEMVRNDWHPFSYIGAKVSVPLFDGFARNRAAQEYRLGMKVNQINLQRIEQNFLYETASANRSFENAKTSLQNAIAARKLAEEILAADQKRFALGTLLQSDLNRSEQLLKDAETNLVQSLYNFLLADLNVKKAAGLL
jgi:outer membrane protein TolC